MRRAAPAPRIRTAPRVTRRCSADNGQERRLDHHFDDQPWTKAEALRSLAVKQRYLVTSICLFGGSAFFMRYRAIPHTPSVRIGIGSSCTSASVSFLVRCPLKKAER